MVLLMVQALRYLACSRPTKYRSSFCFKHCREQEFNVNLRHDLYQQEDCSIKKDDLLLYSFHHQRASFVHSFFFLTIVLKSQHCSGFPKLICSDKVLEVGQLGHTTPSWNGLPLCSSLREVKEFHGYCPDEPSLGMVNLFKAGEDHLGVQVNGLNITVNQELDFCASSCIQQGFVPMLCHYCLGYKYSQLFYNCLVNQVQEENFHFGYCLSLCCYSQLQSNFLDFCLNFHLSVIY